MAEGILDNFVVILARDITRLQDSMVYIDYTLHKLVDWSIEFEVEVQRLCSLKWNEVLDKME